MGKKRFCEISPLTYQMAVCKNKIHRYLLWMMDDRIYASTKSAEPLDEVVIQHRSLIRRTLGNVDQRLQNNKAINLALAVPHVDGVIIKPGETFSFWRLVGACKKYKGYLEGLMIKGGKVESGIGGGMCQFTNLIHWMVLHSPLTIIEHHHHNTIDMFPDYKRQLPFGTGTSIMHNYLDYRFTNHTNQTFQLLIHTDDTYLCGELRCEEPLKESYQIIEKEHYFVKEGQDYYRCNKVVKETFDLTTKTIKQQALVIENYARVIYDHRFIPVDQIRTNNVAI